MKRPLTLALVCAGAALAAAGCGGDDEDGGDRPASTNPPATASDPARTATAAKPAPRPTGTRIKLAASDYGQILFDGRGQAIYLFTKDGRDRTRCFGDCAEAWPPVYTKGSPRAGKGVNPGLLGTVRREGRLQVTYKGQPLYFYAHEGRNEVRCQNVEEFGGVWLVVKGSGEAVR
jgi:predicted lipoprotein with Yx(FWY)xxD motif